MTFPSHDDCSRDLDTCLPTWPMLCIDGEHTPSDLQWCGIVDEPLAQWLRGPRRDTAKDNPGWQRMIERAKADIDAIDGEWRVKRLAAACTPADVEAFLEALSDVFVNQD